MKRFTSLLLSLLLLGSLGVPAFAASESADERLARVTETVKATLGLDTDAYTEFHGELSEQQLGVVWELYWSGTGTSLNVTALEDGTIVGYWRSDNDEDVYYGRNLPTFPKADAAAAKKAAQAFLARVLDAKTESVTLADSSSDSRLNSRSCTFSGAILLNGLTSPMNYNITVRGSDNTVTSFYRDAPAQTFLGEIPSATPAIAKDAAAQTLRGTLKLELIYVTDESGMKAVLRYVPVSGETVYVDAQTGKLVKPDADLWMYGTNAASGSVEEAKASDAEMDRGLTEVELAGVVKLDGVLDSDALDKKIRAESAYKLDGYTISTADYRLVKNGDDTESVLCTLRYTQSDEDYSGRTFTVDARTGAVKSLWSYGAWDKDRTPAVKAGDAQKAAEAFLKRFSAHADAYALYTTDDSVADGAPSYGFTFVRKVNGYFFPENSATIQIDAMTGAVCGVSETFDEAVVFDDADGVISADKAMDVWAASYETVLAYRLEGKELSQSVAAEKALIDRGVTRFRTLLLSYALEREDYFAGVDAKTAALVAPERYDGTIAYGDTASHWAAKEIETLAKYGVGYAGGSFGADKALTQWDLVCLLASTRGCILDPAKATAEERDSAYETVYRMGALTRAERSDDAAITRGALVKALLGSAGYTAVANLSGIFTCAYADAAQIPAAELGYAALAQGFGLVRDSVYAAGTPATRAMAAVMLYRLMERSV